MQNVKILMSFKELKRYREAIFPASVSDRANCNSGSAPYFSLERWSEWVTEAGRDCFKSLFQSAEKENLPILEPRLNLWESVDISILQEYRSFILPTQSASHQLFELDRAEEWVKDKPFSLFLAYRDTKRSTTGREPSGTAVTRVKPEPETDDQAPSISRSAVSLGKRKAIALLSDNEETIVISSDSEMDTPAQPKQKFQPTRNAINKLPALTQTSRLSKPQSEGLSNSDDEVSCVSDPKKKSAKRAKRQHQNRPRPKVTSGDAIKITQKDSVNAIINLEAIPIIWNVPRTPTAFVVDLSNDNSDDHSKTQSIISRIRHDEQSSWSGSSGRVEGDAFVHNIFGEGKVRARRADFRCRGIKVCEYIDPKLLDGFESWERDDSEMEPFWMQELQENEKEFSDPDGALSRFYRRVQQSKCAPDSQCNGLPTIRKLKTRSFSGKNTFIGCTGWRNGDPRTMHRYLSIDKELNEDDVAFMLRNDGKLPLTGTRDLNVKASGSVSFCSVVLPPRSHKKSCSFTHVIDGKVKEGSIVRHDECSSRLIIFEPVDISIRKAIVIPSHPHNHPRHPHAKPTQKEKDFVRAASKASGVTRISAKALRICASTSSLLDRGQCWESQVPGMTEDTRLRKFLRKENLQEYPRGLDWEGVVYEMGREAKLPKEERYLHTVISKGSVRLVVAMHPEIAKHIHSSRFLAIDYTFKRVTGEMNEWEVAGNIDRYKCRVTFGSLYCNSATRESFKLIFLEFFEVVERVTGRKLEFKDFNPEAKLLALLFDGEAAQMQGCGDVLVLMNNPEISQITTQDPLIVVQYFAKTCCPHFIRNIDELPKDIPRDVINKLKSFPNLDNDEDIEGWHRFCKASPHPAVLNWYKQKIMHPWYLPSVNRFLSPMKEEHWNLTPNDTNMAETAHAARNQETGIGRPLLAAILDARHRDNELVKRLEHFETSFSLGNRWNGPYERESRNASRRANTAKKINTVNAARKKYEEIETQINQLAKQRTDSLARKKEIETRLRTIQAALSDDCSSLSTNRKELQDERSLLKKEDRHGIDTRKEWASLTSKLKSELELLKETDLKNSRVRDPRSQSRAGSSPPPISHPNLNSEELSIASGSAPILMPLEDELMNDIYMTPTRSSEDLEVELGNDVETFPIEDINEDYYSLSLADMPLPDPPSPSSSCISGNFGYDWDNFELDPSLAEVHLTEEDREDVYTFVNQYMEQHHS